MLNDVLGNCPQVKTLDYLLAHPFDSYTKQQIAIGAEISRSTLNNFIDELINYNLLIKNEEGKFRLNNKSNIIKELDNIQYQLSLKEFAKQTETFNEENIIEYSDEEIDKMFPTDIPDINLDEAEKEIEKEEEILVNRLDYENAVMNEKLANIKLKQYKNIKKEIDTLNTRINVIEKNNYYRNSETKYDEKINKNPNFLNWGIKNLSHVRSH